MELDEWTRIFLKQRDVVKREIERFESVDDGFLVRRKDGSSLRVVVSASLLFVEADVVVCENTRENVHVLVKEWERFSGQEGLLVVFAHPGTGEKWLLKPFHHGKVADPKSLEQGLLSMHDAITGV